MSNRVLTSMLGIVVSLLVLITLLVTYSEYKLVLGRALPDPYVGALGFIKPIEIEVKGGVAVSTEDFLKRPLFWVERRVIAPVENVENKPVVVSDSLSKVKLLGTYFSNEDGAGVIVGSKDEKKRIPLGGEFLGWKLDKVGVSTATFLKGNELKLLELEHAKSIGEKVLPEDQVGAVSKPRELDSKQPNE